MDSTVKPARRSGRASRFIGLVLAGLVGVVPTLVVTQAVTQRRAEAQVVTAAATAQPRGIDIANYQHPYNAAIDWAAVRNSGIEFAFIKATEGPTNCTGNYYTNSWIKKDWADAGAAGLYRGAYHFGRPGDTNSAIQQARYFANAVGPMNGPRDLPPVLDLEATCGLNANAVATWARAFVDETVRLTGRQPIIYTGYYFWRDNVGNNPSFSNLPLWVATYGSKPMVPTAWSTWSFWQYSDKGQIPGIQGNVDVNWFQFGSDGLARLAGSGNVNPNPIGALETTSTGMGSVTVNGWAIDPNSFSPISTHVYVNGAYKGNTVADKPHSGVATKYPFWGANHGYSTTITGLNGGSNQVCVYAINTGPGDNVLLECRTVQLPSNDPVGWLDQATGGPGNVRVQGWAGDVDSPNALSVKLLVDGVQRTTAAANLSRPDIQAFFGWARPNHGYDLTLNGVAAGSHNVCVVAVNLGAGADKQLGCKTVSVAGGAPIGHVGDIYGVPGGAKIKGWTIDPDTTNAIPVHVYVDGVFTANPVANVAVPALNAYFPQYGINHGFDLTVPMKPGKHKVCTYGINTAGANNHTLLNCTDIEVFAGAPLGKVESVVGGRANVTIKGWTIDPDTTAANQVHVYIDGVYRGNPTAAAPRGDLRLYGGSPYQGYGEKHGIDTTITGVGPGWHDVCTYGINTTGSGNHMLLNCTRTFVYWG